MERSGFWWKAEPFLFIAIVLITSVPVISHLYFPTVDGPAHLHNANLLKHFWFEGNGFILNFFYLNKHLNSNFVDHIWFALAGLFLPGYLVEKSILLFYVLAMPFSFRYLAQKISDNKNSARLCSYLIFPFIYSFTFRIGFFNFCIGIPVLFWTLGYWIAQRDNLNWKKTLRLAVLATLLYISHMFNFMLFGIIVTCVEMQYILSSKTFKGLRQKFISPFFIFLPGLILSLLFVISNSNFEHSPPTYLSKEKLTSTIVDLSPVITLSYENEILFARIIGMILCVLVFICLTLCFKKRNHDNSGSRPYWILPTFVVLLFFYLFPDWVVSGGYISIRWALYFFLMLIILIAAKGIRPIILVVPVLLLMINHMFFINYHNEQTTSLSDDAATLVKAEEFMEDDKVLLPLNYSANWIQINHAGYMAINKNIINLDNYEPTKPHFPLIWKKGEQVYDLMLKYGNRYPPCINIANYENVTHHRIDYLSRFCFNGDVTDSCTALVEEEIKNKFELIYRSENNKLVLYKRKPNT